jgi:hypothetical protein
MRMISTKRELEGLLADVGALLKSQHQRLEVAAIGGGSLMLLGLIERPTRDIDLVGLVEDGKVRRSEPLPKALEQAILDVARLRNIDSDWMNAAPSQISEHGLPEGFMERAVRREYGGLVVYLASRKDQICFKLYAAVDQGPDSKHTADLRLLMPTADELAFAAAWAKTQDPSEGFSAILSQVLEAFEVEHESR